MPSQSHLRPHRNQRKLQRVQQLWHRPVFQGGGFVNTVEPLTLHAVFAKLAGGVFWIMKSVMRTPLQIQTVLDQQARHTQAVHKALSVVHGDCVLSLMVFV